MQAEKNSPSYAVKPPISFADQIYLSLKTGILNGQPKPGSRLYETETAKSFQASRTPVREAFRRLEQDCLVERMANGGVRVVQLEPSTLRDLFHLRAVLEVHVMELACERITPEKIAALKQIKVQAMEMLNTTGLERDYKIKRFMELNSLFHETIYEATGSKFLIRIISQLRGIVQGLRAMSIQDEQSWIKTWDEHRRLIDYLEERNSEKAQVLIGKHVEWAYNHVLAKVSPA
jgi:DNA-binding GntR family transcriptional regulator